MAIFNRSELLRDLQELETRYQTLKRELTGSEPNPNLFEQYANDPEYFRSHFVEIDLGRLDLAIHDFQGPLKILGTAQIKKRQAPKHRR